MLISVVIPVYNSGNTALAAIASVMSQTDKYDYEIVVVDDCSADESLSYLKANVPQKENVTLKYIRHEVNMGSGSARNTGIKEVTGEYFAFLDSDDVWLPGKVEKQVDFLENNPEYGMVGCLTNMPGSFIPPFTSKNKKLIDITTVHQCFKCFFQPSTVTIRTALFKEKVEWPHMRYGDEGDAFIHFTHYYKACLQNEILVNYANGKRGFGFSGVSKRLAEMQSAELQNLKMAYDRRYISWPLYMIVLALSKIKYQKRVIISKSR